MIKKNRNINIRLSEEELKQLCSICEKLNLSKSRLIIKAVYLLDKWVENGFVFLDEEKKEEDFKKWEN